MGDRGNIFIQESMERDGVRVGVFLYGHWSGYKMPAILQRALKNGHSRWTDPQYFARICFQEMVGKDKGLTGFGISARLRDNSYPILVANCETQVVEMYERPDGEPFKGKPMQSWPFGQYVELSLTDEDNSWRSLGIKD